MKKRTKILLIIVGALIALGIIGKMAGWFGKKPGVEVAVEKAELRNITEMVSANGKIQPEVEVKISADVSGEIVELHVKEGQKVQKGQHLLTINPDLIQSAADRVAAALNQTKANLANAKARENQAKANFVNAEQSFNRSKKLRDQQAISAAEYDAAVAQFEGAKGELEAAKQSVFAAEFAVNSAQASLKEANDNLNRTRIYAPTDGTISKLNVELGERVVGTAQMSGTELLRIANLSEMEVSVDVNENDIVRIQLNDTANVEVDAYGDRVFKGIVTEIANSSKTAGDLMNTGDQVTNFSVKIRILRSSYEDLLDTAQAHLSPFRPGMSATVDVLTETQKNVIAVPIMAVTTRLSDDSTKKSDSGMEELDEVVFVHQNGKIKKVNVKTGIQDMNHIRILEGIKVGDEVVSAPYTAISKILRDSMDVIVVDASSLYNQTE
ncbi:MAG: efflux RND transporter periplasmic adaptor subunit [Bacteroidia bacterium]|jgi:HlyD family secretion protein